MLTHATLGQIAEAIGKDKSVISRQAAKQEWPYEERPERGGLVRHYPVASLPTKVAQALTEKYWADRLGADQGAADAPEDLDSLKVWAKSRAVRLSPKELADPDIAKKLYVARMMEECPKYMGKVALADQLAAKYGRTRPTIYCWVKEVKQWRVEAKTPSAQIGDFKIDLPKTRAFDPDAFAWGAACYASNLKQGKKWAFGQLEAKSEEFGWKLGDYASFCRLLGKIPQGVWDSIRKGPTGFELQYAPKITRAWLETPAYSVLCGDQNVLDYVVLDEMTGEILVMNLYLWMDCTSRAWTGMWPAFGPYRSYTVGYSLREALRFGLPTDEIYTDWGKCELGGYVADVRMALSRYCVTGDFMEMQARYNGFDHTDWVDGGIKHRKARPGVPWLKPIENQMNILKRGLLDLDLPGFRQKEVDAWANKIRQQDVKIAKRNRDLLTLEQMLESLLAVFERHNREACKLRELRGGTIVPGRVLADGLRERNLTVLADETLDYMFLPSFERTAQRGLVAAKIGPYDHREFFCPELTKAKGADRKVRVYCDLYDPTAPAKITTLNGDFIGLGEPWGVVAPGDEKALRDKIAAQKRLLKGWREGVAKIMAPYAGLGTDGIGPYDKPARKAGQAEREREAINDARERADQKIIELYRGGKRA